LAILWFQGLENPNAIMTPGDLSKVIKEAGLGQPHSTKLGESLQRTGKVLRSSQGLRLTMLARSELREQFKGLAEASPADVDHEQGFLPGELWRGTRGYIERVCEQLNGCYQYGLYDAASVMLRRLIETLVIEAYEHAGRESEIRDSGGNYLMLRDLAARATGNSPIGLGRDAKDALNRIKEMGDRSAHNRRYNALRADLDKVQSGARVIVDELLNLAALRSAANVQRPVAP
jgi:hypothetical protein